MFERCLYFNTNTLARKLNARWEKAFDPFDLAPSHAYLLRLVLDSPGLTQQELTTELQLNKSTVTRFVSALEKKKLVLRKEGGEDQRSNSIWPSPKAVAIKLELEQLGDELYASMCSAIGKKNAETFVEMARKINNEI
ncbi:MarR family winged helix-turn-helix transcriptional regulator [Agaribacterium sp. ZY112]|uniref:MarR family winged helix-turn-helix transcriptional regulator n=1 Tax=Agaribacterium sp. ZY112 TaxID=3233574 RepID=UPI00352348A4